MIGLRRKPFCALCVGALMSIAAGCGRPAPPSQPASGTPAARPRGIALRCPMPAKGSPSGAPDPKRVFLEVAQVDGGLPAPSPSPGPAPPSLSALLDDPRVDVPRVGGIMATIEAPATLPWDTLSAAPGRPCEAVERWDLTLTPRVAGPGRVKLAIALEPARPPGTPPEAWQVPAHRAVKTEVEVQDQQTTVLGMPRVGASSRPSVVVVTPYFLRDDDDLRQLMQCKAAAAGRGPGVSSAPGVPPPPLP
jgi:hypothetical protein